MLATVIARFPCRAIVLCGSDDPARKVTAEISALCHLPAPGQPQVCSERIVLRAGPNAVDLLPGAVRSLLEADLPQVLWWTSDPRKHESLFRDLADVCSRLVLDLPDPGAEVGALRLGLDPALGTCSRDSVWFGLAPLARAGRAVLRLPGSARKAGADRLGASSRPSRPIRPDRPGWRSGWWLAGRPARLEAARPPRAPAGRRFFVRSDRPIPRCAGRVSVRDRHPRRAARLSGLRLRSPR